MTPITSLGGFIMVDRGPGNDFIKSTSINADDGGEGDDVVLGDEAFVNLAGGEGNDWLIQMTGYEYSCNLVGGPGDDNLCDLGDGSVLLGEDGFDRGWNGDANRSRGMEGTLSGDECWNLAFAVTVGWPF